MFLYQNVRGTYPIIHIKKAWNISVYAEKRALTPRKQYPKPVLFVCFGTIQVQLKTQNWYLLVIYVPVLSPTLISTFHYHDNPQ